MDDFLVFLLFSFFGIYLLHRLNRMALRARQNQIKEEIIRETLRQHIQKRKLDELYGRDE